MCDPYFDSLALEIPCDVVSHSGPDLYRRFCGWVFNEKLKLKNQVGLMTLKRTWLSHDRMDKRT